MRRRVHVSEAERAVGAQQDARRELKAAHKRFLKAQDGAHKEEAGKDLIRALFGKDAIAAGEAPNRPRQRAGRQPAFPSRRNPH